MDMKKPFLVEVTFRDDKVEKFLCDDRPSIQGDWVWINTSIDSWTTIATSAVLKVLVKRVA